MSRQTTNRYRYAWHGSNQFSLLVDGGQFYPAMLSAIGQAKYIIALEMYLVESGTVVNQFITALVNAAKRGVKVFILLDDFGARSLSKQDRQRLKQPGIQFCLYNPLYYGELRRSLFRDHRKLLLIDNDTAFIGGAGITDKFDSPENNSQNWHDLMIAIQGDCLKDWQNLFIENWPEDSQDLMLFSSLPGNNHNDFKQLGRVTVSQASTRKEVQRSLIRRIISAEHWVWLTTAYFVPSWKMRRALMAAAKRGIDVRLILPGQHTDHPAVRHAGRRFYYNLLRHGVKIYEYQPRFTHAKLYLCDQWCSLGSSNLDRWNLLWNLEANQEIDDQHFSTEIKTLFLQDLEHCREIKLETWRQRPWHRRTLEWFWGRVDVWLHRLATYWRRHK